MNEEIEFWNDFAREYTDIQAESKFPIVQDLKDYLCTHQLLPINSVLDLAGGSGKYLPVFIDQVTNYTLVDFSSEMLNIAKEMYPSQSFQTIEMDQDSFLKETADDTYDIVFTAMNPALQTQQQLKELCRIAKEKVLILRMIREEDSLFSPIEKLSEDKPQSWMEEYKQWSANHYQSFIFHYSHQEEISKAFFEAYFEDDFNQEQLQKIVTTIFKNQETCINYSKVDFELLIIDTLG
jgi:Methylase involved in ubiquinone/menaquinone biosynthesis